MDLDMNRAIEYAQLVNAAYAIQPGNLANSAGQKITAGGRSYTVVTSLYANDLATDIDPARGTQRVSIGLICQADGTGEIVIAVRGTEGIREWMLDAEFLYVRCPILPGSGHSEDGFTAVYLSLRTGVEADAPAIAPAMATLPFVPPGVSLTICGHSLGGAVATLLALDVAANTAFNNPTVYTYASPRTGDRDFASTYNQVVKNTYRIANRVDVVPKLPLPPAYEHVNTHFDLNPIQLLPLPPRVLLKMEVACQHVLNSYLHLMSLNSGGPVIPPDPGCAA